MSEQRVNIFISWSTDRGKALARTLREALPRFDEDWIPWMSEDDLKPGEPWSEELLARAAESNIGIICITPESLRRPWVIFEAGAIFGGPGKSLIFPYLLDVCEEDLGNPLELFNATCATSEEDNEKMLARIAEDQHGEEQDDVAKKFEVWWAYYQKKLGDGLAGIEPSSEARPDESESQSSAAVEAIARNVPQSLKYKDPVFRRELLTDLQKFCRYTEEWTNGRFMAFRKFDSMLIDLYKSARRSVFSVCLAENMTIWANAVGDNVLEAQEESHRQNNCAVKRVFILGKDQELGEPVLEILRHQDACEYVDLRIITDEHGLTKGLEFTIIDEGAAIGLSKHIDGERVDAYWHFDCDSGHECMEMWREVEAKSMPFKVFCERKELS